LVEVSQSLLDQVANYKRVIERRADISPTSPARRRTRERDRRGGPYVEVDGGHRYLSLPPYPKCERIERSFRLLINLTQPFLLRPIIAPISRPDSSAVRSQEAPKSDSEQDRLEQSNLVHQSTVTGHPHFATLPLVPRPNCNTQEPSTATSNISDVAFRNEGKVMPDSTEEARPLALSGGYTPRKHRVW